MATMAFNKAFRHYAREFAIDVYKYISGGRNAHDDGPDCLTRIAERLTGTGGIGPVNKCVYGTKNMQIRVARVVERR